MLRGARFAASATTHAGATGDPELTDRAFID
jgi:hypothetical protein